MIMFVLILLAAVAATVAVTLGGHVYAWEELAWAWSAVLWCGIAKLEGKP